MVKSIIVAVIVGACCSIIAYSLMWLIALPSSPNVRIKKQIKELIKKRDELQRTGKLRESNEIAYDIRRLESKLSNSKL
jgi:uncharacterized membrane protein (DUF106 family)